jgi:hypothetical protein
MTVGDEHFMLQCKNGRRLQHTLILSMKLTSTKHKNYISVSMQARNSDAYKKFPSLSTLKQSPVLNHPSSTNVSCVAFSLSQYPNATFLPRRYSSPGSSRSASMPSSRTMRASCPGMRIPVLSTITGRPRAP